MELKFKKLIATAFMGGLLIAPVSQADVSYTLTEDFGSGITFAGSFSFVDGSISLGTGGYFTNLTGSIFDNGAQVPLLFNNIGGGYSSSYAVKFIEDNITQLNSKYFIEVGVNTFDPLLFDMSEPITNYNYLLLNDSIQIFASQVCIDGICNTGVAPVPVPAAFWLFGSALASLIGFNRRKPT